ncbi:hypothetical protein [Allokutzneria albata]|uniref:Uncharacterized protein n=1 Tax=Allokutzneria albata TaxID=211114 RepID=A0A1G9W9Q2_ALLAB|nr:hypothetical protein [Allokutzneria albata]SDM81288.1 hypothetical protein SAMN04489726_3482 [Allokutzneria albata]
MPAKSNPGGNSGSGPSPSVPPPPPTPYRGGGNEKLSVDTDGMRKGGDRYRDVGDVFHTFATQHERLLSYKPLQNGESDETWEKFEPDYLKGTRGFINGVRGLAQLTRAIADGVDDMALGHEKTERNNIELSRSLLRKRS